MSASPIPAAALDHHVAVLGKTGSGKSYAAQGIAEDLIEKKRRVCVVDPTDRYWGLRLLADGKNPSGYEPVIFGGQHADLPVAATHGAALAEIAGTTTTPIIISTRLMTVGERSRFFTDFAETLLRKNEGPLHLIIDEAHLFAPQTKVQSVESGKLLHATNNLVSLGRGIGLRIMLLSQRPAKLHKDSLTQVETLVALRLIAPQDRNAIKEWVKEWADEATGAEMMASLPSLPTGTAWVWAPELDVLRKAAFPANNTYDSGKPPAAGRKGPELAPIDLAKVGARLETIAKEAVENDPRRLKAEIADLKRQLAAKPKEAPFDPEKLQAVYQDGRRDGFNAAIGIVGDRFQQILDEARPLLEQIKTAAQEAVAIVTRPANAHYMLPPDPQPRGPSTGRPHPTGASREHTPGSAPLPPPTAKGLRFYREKPRAAGSGAHVSRPQRRILDALAWLKSLGIDRGDRVRVAMLADQSPRSSGYEKNISTLRTAGLIDYPGPGDLALTPEGEAQAAPPELAPTSEALHEMIRRHVSGPQWRVLEALISCYPEALSREELADRSDQSALSSGFEKNVSTLRSLGFIDYPGQRQVVALPVLFIEGR